MELAERNLADGSPYTILTLGNSTGNVATEPFWSERQGEVKGIHKGHVVQIIGDVVTYRDRKQIRVASIRPLPEGSVNPADLLPSVGSVERYWEVLDGWRNQIQKPRLKRVVDLFYEDDEFRSKYEQCPAAVRGHHAALGGLLKHTTEVAAIARAIARASGADQDLVLAGVLLHDIGKIEGYRWDDIFDYTQAGNLVGHVVLGALMLNRRLDEEAEPVCTELERDILLHLILSHHGRKEFGSPIEPMTLEAEILHYADDASAKTASISDVLKNPLNFADGLLSTPQWTLDKRRVFRGSSDWGAGDEGW